jgi:hypothetical protein
MTTCRLTIARAARVLAGAGLAAGLAACAKRAEPPATAPTPAASAASAAARDSQHASDLRRTLVAYYARVEWTYTGGRCAITDPRGGLTRSFECGRLRIGTRPDADVTDLVRTVRGRTVDLHPGDAPWRRIVVPTESERAALLRLLEDDRVRWAQLDLQAPGAQPRRRSPPRTTRPRRAAPAPPATQR